MINQNQYILSILKKITDFLFKLPVPIRRSFLSVVDFSSLLFSIFILSYIYIDITAAIEIINLKFLIILFIFTFLVNSLTGQYKGLTVYSGSSSIYKLALRNLLISFGIYILFSFLNEYHLPFTFYILNWMLMTLFFGSIRIIIRDLFILITKKFLYSKNIIIYGAGKLGAQLFSALRFNGDKKVVGFIDDDAKLWKRNIFGCNIYEPSIMEKLIKKYKVEEVYLAMPSITNLSKEKILNILNRYKLKISQIKSLENISTLQDTIDSLKPITIEELLGRTQVSPDKELLNKSVFKKSVLITGGGGSIGSELAKQIINLNPKEIIIVDNSEASLYLIDKELNNLNNKEIKIKSYLGDVSESSFIFNTLKENKVQIIYHACAYKHVPLVELNPISAIKNNIFSTFNLVKAALKFDVEKLILISSDKAVRPINIMGLTKRVSELIIYEYSKKKYIKNISKHTIFSIVRFGNVLGSSGSVVPLFKEQIAKGGPVTVTHPDVIRYFMTIKEASQLVIQASALALGGDLFILDMGKPIKILELAKQMIKLSGKNYKKNKNNFNDDHLEIKFTGLRKGEKLYEELLINKNKSFKTKHPLIFRGDESSKEVKNIIANLEKLENTINKNDLEDSLKLLSEIVIEWNA